jgi:hypothetical protein
MWYNTDTERDQETAKDCYLEYEAELVDNISRLSRFFQHWQTVFIVSLISPMSSKAVII